MKTTTLVIKATARELVATTYAVLVHVHVSVFLLSSKVVVLNGLLKLPTRFPQTTVCTANMHGHPISWYVSTTDTGMVGGSGTDVTV